MTRLATLLVIPLFLLWGCTEKIDVKLDSSYARLVVDGHIESDSGTYIVALTETSDYFANAPAPRVVNAEVTISDGSQTYPMTETAKGISGLYATPAGFRAEHGKTYTLSVDLQNEIAGVKSAAASCYLPPVTHLDSIAATFHLDWGKKGAWTIKLWAQEPGDEVNYYLFNYYRNGKLMSDTITKKVVSDDKFYNGSYMTGVDVIYINNMHEWETLHTGDTVTLQMSGITKEYFDFVNQVSQAGFSIPFFSGPPANVQGNVSNGGVGFFAAWSNSYATCIVK